MPILHGATGGRYNSRMSIQDAKEIWQAGVAAVDSAEAVRRHVTIDGSSLVAAGVRFDLNRIGRIEVVGAGKAGAGMAAGLEAALLSHVDEHRVSGWVNVPADCVRPLRRIHLHAARPAGLNEPTEQGVEGTREILWRVQSLSANDVCIVLLSGGASALLCSPVPEITLSDKLAVTRALAGNGAPIQELNLVRTQLSQVKGGRLAAACGAASLVGLVISDVVGDPLDIIGSGPTTASPSRAELALKILSDRGLLSKIPERVLAFLESKCGDGSSIATTTCEVTNTIVGSNRIALQAATEKAIQLGYEVQSLGSERMGDAADEGRDMFRRLISLRDQSPEKARRICLLSGGEPTVNLNASPPLSSSALPCPGKGGRNQELVLAAVQAWPNADAWQGLTLLSGGTDGEDGPTNAAGVMADASLIERMNQLQLNPHEYLLTHNSWLFFDQLNSLLLTGPTHTNVMDLRVGLVT